MVSESVEALLGLAPLEIGQRVRVRLSSECPAPHWQAEEGLEGIVAEPPGYCVSLMDGHSVWVNTPGIGAVWPFARTELERL